MIKNHTACIFLVLLALAICTVYPFWIDLVSADLHQIRICHGPVSIGVDSWPAVLMSALRLSWCFGFAKKHFFVGVVTHEYNMLPSASRFIALWVDKAKEDVMVGKRIHWKFLWFQSVSTTGWWLFFSYVDRHRTTMNNFILFSIHNQRAKLISW